MGAYRELRKLPRGVALLMSLTNASRLHAPPQTVVFCVVYQRAGRGKCPARLSDFRVARSPSDDVNEYEEEVERWSAFTRRISARVIFISPERRLAHCAESAGR